MTSPTQVEIVADHVEDARRKGARILTGGRRKEGPGDWYEPTVIADADHSMKVMRDETFGPVIAGDEGARHRRGGADGERHHATASVGARVRRRGGGGEQIARRIEAGTVAVNDVFMTNFSVLGRADGGLEATPGSATATATSGFASSAAPSRSTVPASGRPKREPSGSRTARDSGASQAGYTGCSTPATSATGSGC